MTEGNPVTLAETLERELGNALMAVLSFAQIIDRQAPGNPVIHNAVDHIKQAVSRADHAAQTVAREMSEIARRLSR